MNTGVKSVHAWIALILVAALCGACSNENGSMKPATAPQSSASVALAAAQAKTTASSSGSEKGAGGEMPAFYDGDQITINSVELPEDASAATIASNKSLNQIYATNDLDDPQDFLPVVDAIQSDGFNPLWRQNLIVFNPGFTPHQFKSDEEVLDAAGGANPEIHLVVTDEVYRCAVVTGK
jgi:hypothetical protein